MSDIELEEGESILWQGKPQQPIGPGQWWQLYTMAIISGFLVFWSFLGPVPEGMESLHEFVSVPFCRAILGFMCLFAAMGPAINARSSNKSCYTVTSTRVIIRTPVFRSSYTETCFWADVHRTTLKPMHNGLASLRLIYTKRNDSEYSIMLLHAIPQQVAEQIVALCKAARD